MIALFMIGSLQRFDTGSPRVRFALANIRTIRLSKTKLQRLGLSRKIAPSDGFQTQVGYRGWNWDTRLHFFPKWARRVRDSASMDAVASRATPIPLWLDTTEERF